jgi:Rieske Fe-S protein
MDRCVKLERRTALRRIAGLAAGVFLLDVPTLTGCSSGPAGDGTVKLPLAGLPEGRRSNVVVAGVTVELLRDGPTVRARSLLCTHQGCTVRWDAPARLYRCPCHKGIFDETGNVVSGAPIRPLDAYPFTVENGEIVIRALATKST